MTTILICGGRSYGVDFTPRREPPEVRAAGRELARKQRWVMERTLNGLFLEFGPFRLVEGGAPGADACAQAWAYKNRSEHKQHKADWKRHGKAAGPIRNAQMLAMEQPDLVIAFPGGKGTASMVGLARAAGVEVREIKA